MLLDIRRNHLVRRAQDLRSRGKRLFEQADEILALLDREPDGTALADGSSVDGTLDGDTLLAAAQSLYATRRRRERIFPANLFGEPAWDIMLDLYVQARRGSRVSISSACLAGGTAPTTGLRWLGILENQGLVERERNMQDGRMSWVHLTQTGIDLMHSYLADLVSESQ